MGGGTVRRWPSDWHDCLTLIAGNLNVGKSLDDLDLDELLFWTDRAKDWAEWQTKSSL